MTGMTTASMIASESTIRCRSCMPISPVGSNRARWQPASKAVTATVAQRSGERRASSRCPLVIRTCWEVCLRIRHTAVRDKPMHGRGRRSCMDWFLGYMHANLKQNPYIGDKVTRTKSMQEELLSGFWRDAAAGRGPRYLRIVEFIERGIADGRLRPGDRLP